MDKITAFWMKEKFTEDLQLFYPGISDLTKRALLTRKINEVADDFRSVSLSDKPTHTDYQQKIELGLMRFSEVYLELDTEDRERVCAYFEELMDIVGVTSSAGKLNRFMYGFDPEE